MMASLGTDPDTLEKREEVSGNKRGEGEGAVTRKPTWTHIEGGSASVVL